MSEVYCVAVTLAKAEHLQTVRAELEALIPLGQQEQGVLQYEMYVDQTEPRRFVFIEKWESAEDFQAHVNAPHVQAFLANTEGLIEENFFHPLFKH